MAAAAILLIKGTQTKTNLFLSALNKRYQVVVAHSGSHGLSLAQQQPFAAIILDAVSMQTPGERICRRLKTTFQDIPVVHIHPGPRDQTKSVADVVLFHPLSVRRLVNSVGRLINVSSEEVISYGPFQMNIPRRILIAYGKETQLTPKLASLVEIFFRNPGQTLDRKTLMEKVWETDYLGDTRTLDVHIRWARKILENGGAKPRYLRTVRGVGYKLIISEDEIL